MGFCILNLKMTKKSGRRSGYSGYLQNVPKPMIPLNGADHTDTKPSVCPLCDTSESDKSESEHVI